MPTVQGNNGSLWQGAGAIGMSEKKCESCGRIKLFFGEGCYIENGKWVCSWKCKEILQKNGYIIRE